MMALFKKLITFLTTKIKVDLKKELKISIMKFKKKMNYCHIKVSKKFEIF